MEKSELIRRIAVELGFTLTSSPVFSGDDASFFYVSVATHRNSKGQQIPTHKQLAVLRDRLQASGISIRFILENREVDDAEPSLRRSLIASYPDEVRNVFLSDAGRRARIWIDYKRLITAEKSVEITEHVRAALTQYGLEDLEVLSISDEPLPTNIETLGVIRRHAPITCERLKHELENREFTVPSLDWINRRFDALRKSGLVVRLADRSYVVSAEGLHRMGTAKNRRSPDVARLLALARQRR